MGGKGRGIEEPALVAVPAAPAVEPRVEERASQMHEAWKGYRRRGSPRWSAVGGVYSCVCVCVCDSFPEWLQWLTCVTCAFGQLSLSINIFLVVRDLPKCFRGAARVCLRGSSLGRELLILLFLGVYESVAYNAVRTLVVRLGARA